MAAHSERLDVSGFKALIEQASLYYRTSGRGPYYFCRGKLAGDPVFSALLSDGHFDRGAKILDLGCGQGVLAALLAASKRAQSWTLLGIDLRAGAIAVARRALASLHSRVRFEVGDVRAIQLPPSDVVVLLDVLHYMDYAAQERVLTRVHDALCPGGKLLLRVGDTARGWRFGVTLASDWIATTARGTFQRRFWCRPLHDWIGLLEATGFEVQTQPMSAGTPFANVLVTAIKRGDPPL
jgi:2-polyprenyl-3-methyl-5-hydroxy-6-metoxy-1,4-benzoquinol methylase